MSKYRKNVFEKGVDNYSINLMWINDIYREDQKYIYPSGDTEELKEKLLDICFSWASQHKKAEVKIWHDSKLHSKEAVENTTQVLQELSNKNGCNNISLHDIRKIKFVNDNEILFTQDIGKYTRIDFLKLIIIAHELIDNDYDGAVYADVTYRDSFCGIKSDKVFNADEIFDLASMEKMNKYGVLLGKGRGFAENQFIQAVNDKLIVDVLRHIVNADALRIMNLLNDPQKFSVNDLEEMYKIPFVSTIKELSKLYLGLKAGTVKVNEGFLLDGIPVDKWIEYDPEVHGYEPLGNVMNRRTGDFNYVNYQAKPATGFHLDKIIKYGFTQDDCLGVRGESRSGRSHIDKFVSPPEGHEPYKPYFWEADPKDLQVEVSGVVEQA